MIIGMVIGLFTGRLSVIASILCIITSIFCFCQSFKKLGDDTNPLKRQRTINYVTIDGFCIPIVSAIAILNLVIYDFKLLIVFIILGIVFKIVTKTIKFIKKIINKYFYHFLLSFVILI